MKKTLLIAALALSVPTFAQVLDAGLSEAAASQEMVVPPSNQHVNRIAENARLGVNKGSHHDGRIAERNMENRRYDNQHTGRIAEARRKREAGAKQ